MRGCNFTAVINALFLNFRLNSSCPAVLLKAVGWGGKCLFICIFFYLTYLCLLVLWFKQQKTEWSKVRVDGVEFSHNCWWLTDPTVYISSPSDGDDVCSRRASTILGLGLCIPPSAIFRKRSFAILACKAGRHSGMSDWGQEAGEKDAGVLADGRPIWASSVPGGGPKGPTEPPGRGRVP